MRPPLDAPVAVVGAGIAGLAAAHTLSKNGFPVVVFESADRVGGRMASIQLDGARMDTGAQFLSSEYAVLRTLSEEVGLDTQWRDVGGLTSILCPDGLRTFDPGSALGLWRSGTLSFRAWTALLRHALRSRALSKRPLSDYSAWADQDTELASEWGHRCIGAEAVNNVFDPVLQGFYFQTADETSRALMAGVLAFGFRRAKTKALCAGMCSLPTALARSLDVRLNTAVRSLEQTAAGALVRTDDEAFHAKAVVVCTPAPVAAGLLEGSSLGSEARALLATRYTSTVCISIVADAGYPIPETLSQSYGVLFSRHAGSPLAAISNESFKGRTAASGAHLFNLMLTHTAARAHWNEGDARITDIAVDAAQELLPGLGAHVRHSHVARWGHAEPCSPVGRARHAAAYRRATQSRPAGIVLAGDYTGMPYTEGAAESGVWAAGVLRQVLERRSQ